MSFIAGRVPIQLSPQQSFLVILVGGLVGIALLGGLLLETLVGGGIATVLRVIGVKRPAKSRARTAIDEFEARVRRAQGPGGPPDR